MKTEKISEEETKHLQHLIFTCRSRASQFFSLIPDQETANQNLLKYLNELADKYGCDYKEIMSDGEIVRKTPVV